MSVLPPADRFLGCLLGQAVGDGLGAPFEGLPAEMIYDGFGAPSDILKNPTGETLYYTDDTQMMIGVAETLVAHGEIIEDRLCEAFATNYHPARGYGTGARRVLEALIAGEDWRALAYNLFPGGSFGNGAAMRAAPIGLLFCDDLDRVMEQARLAALPTHVHPLGIEGAQLLALAVALAVREPQFDKKAFYRELLHRASSEEFQWQLSAAAKLTAGNTLSFLGNSLEAHRSVVTAIACFTVSPNSYEEAIGRAIGLGNDTDTLAAMAGAVSGAHLGVRAVPSHLIEKLEDNHKGRSYMVHLADRVYEVYKCRHAAGQ
jgi:poly(ADP-ribose) glycohydrolase ARH3